MSKKISINPDFFKISGSKKKNKKSKKFKPVFDKKKIKPNDIRKKLIQRVKEHQKKEKDKELEKQHDKVEKFQNNFEETINYLESVVKKRKKDKRQKKQNKTVKNKDRITENAQLNMGSNILIDLQPMHNNEDINTNKSNINNSDPPYGCLKGGKKPTFRQWRKTLKNNNKDKVPIKQSLSDNIDFSFEKETNKDRIQKLENIKRKIKKEKREKRKIKTKTIKRSIILEKKDGFVSVLVKNKKTRKKIQREVNILKKKGIQEVKDYLRRHNLIKIGSNSPEYVLRNMYENAYLSGNVLNKNRDILLHNWHKDSDNNQ